MGKEFLIPSEEVLAEKDSSANGLSRSQAAERLEKHGANRLAQGKKTTIWERLAEQIKNPMIIILLAAALVSAITAAYAGESFADVFIILFVVILNAILGVVQESKAEAAIEALNKMAASQSKVIRDGHLQQVDSDLLVPGDIVALDAGDAVPADCRLLEVASLKVEESALTGESVAVTKISEPIESHDGKVSLGDRRNMVYMGSSVVYGRATAVVCDTGMNTEMGKIADAISQAKDEQTPLQIKLGQLSRILTYLVLVICVLILAVNLIRGGGLLDTFMTAVSLAVAAIPEGLAAVVTIVLSMGVTKMSRRNAIVRRLTAVETLGCAQIICSDKTGTLTQNRMTVVDSRGDESLLASAVALCSDAEPDENGIAVGEPTECALVNYAYVAGYDKRVLLKNQPRVAEAPFDSIRKMMTTVHRTENGTVIAYTKGAPDEVLKKCTHILKNGKQLSLSEEDRLEILTENKSMADKALRVLAAACRKWDSVPKDCSPENLENELCFIGIVGMIDPVRDEVSAAVAKCRESGIRPVMITGDHINTAVAIAKQLGIIHDDSEALTGAQLDEISEADFEKTVGNYSVYARVQPEHKVRIVNAWKKNGRVTAMTGDGVNDAPSIKTADIGIGMGITGTDVTKNVADMVLADDNFATIVSAVEEGRRIYDNIRKSIQFLLSSNLSEVIAIFSATLFGITILRPVHLLWINLITDSIPALGLGCEKAEGDVMKRPPRNSSQGIFSGGLGADVLIQGLIIAAITVFAYFTGHYLESGVWEIAQSKDGITMAFLTLSMAEIFHSFNMRSREKSVFTIKKQNAILWGGMILSLALTTAVIYVPFARSAFGFEYISANEYFTALGMAVCIIPIVELIKLLRRIVRKNKAQ